MTSYRLRLPAVGALIGALAVTTGAAPPPQSRGPTAAPHRAALQAPAAPSGAPLVVNTVLSNGLEVIVLEDHSIPLVTVNLAVRNGSFTEPPELNGLSHLYEHMFFKSNRATVAQEDYVKTIDQMGLAYGATTREELVEYHLTTTTPSLPVAMRFLRDAMRYPVFDETQFAQAKEAVTAKLDRAPSSLYGTLEAEALKRLFHRYPSRKRPDGTREAVQAATTATMRLIQSRYYVPNNAAVIVTGDASPQSVFLLAEQLFGDWPKRPVDPFVEFPLVEHPPLAKSDVALVPAAVRNVLVWVGWQGPSIGKDDAATYAADVFSSILAQPDSRFQRAMVDSGLAERVGVGYYTQRNVGPISVVLAVEREKARQALQALFTEVSRFADPDYYTNTELENAKGRLEVADLYAREELSTYAQTIAFWWSTAGIDYFRTYYARLRATSRADISRYVSTYIQDKPHVAIALLSPDSLRDAVLTEADLIGAPRTRGPAGGAR